MDVSVKLENAMSVSNSSDYTATTSYVDVPSLGLGVQSTGRPFVVIIEGGYVTLTGTIASGGSPVAFSGFVQVLDNGSVVDTEMEYKHQITEAVTSVAAFEMKWPISIVKVVVPATTGAHTIKVQVKKSTDGAFTFGASKIYVLQW